MTLKEILVAFIMWLPTLWKEDKQEFSVVLLQMISTACFIALYFVSEE